MSKTSVSYFTFKANNLIGRLSTDSSLMCSGNSTSMFSIIVHPEDTEINEVDLNMNFWLTSETAIISRMTSDLIEIGQRAMCQEQDKKGIVLGKWVELECNLDRFHSVLKVFKTFKKTTEVKSPSDIFYLDVCLDELSRVLFFIRTAIKLKSDK